MADMTAEKGSFAHRAIAISREFYADVNVDAEDVAARAAIELHARCTSGDWRCTDYAGTIAAIIRICMAADTWQPMETAPKDGSRVVLWNADWTGPCTGQFYGELLGWRLHYEFGGFAYQPTHWQPLPAAPEPPHV